MSDWGFRAIADRTRRDIIKMLSYRPHTQDALVQRFELSQPAISRHLTVLRQAGLVFAERRGRNVLYALEPVVFRELVRALVALAPRVRA